MASGEDSDFLPSDEEFEHQPMQVEIVSSSEDDFSSNPSSDDEEAHEKFFEEGQNTLDFIQGVETSGQDAFEVLRSKSRDGDRRRSRRIARKPRPTFAQGSDESSLEGSSDEELDEQERERQFQNRLKEEGFEEDLAFPSAGEAGPGSAPSGEEYDEDQVKDEWNEALAEQFGLALPSKKSVRKYGRRDLPEEVSKKLGEANLLYVQERHQEAIAVLSDVVKLAPKAADAYHLLGLLYEEVGDMRRSLNAFMLAATLTPKQVELWRRLADMSNRQGQTRQAIYCLTQVIKRDREDMDSRYDRALLFASLGQRRKAIEGLEQVRAVRPEHPEVVKQLARMYYHTEQHDKAADVLREYWRDYPDSIDFTHVNLLAELLGSPEINGWEEVLEVLAKTEAEVVKPDKPMPIELEVKGAFASARLGDIDAAIEKLKPLQECPIVNFDDLFLAAADTFESIARDDQAEPFLRALADDPETTGFEIWRRLAECCKRLNGPAAAVEVWKRYTEDIDASNIEFMNAIVALADSLRAAGDEAGAVEALRRLGGELPLTGSIAGAEAFSSENDIIQRANILKACGRHDLLIHLSLSSLITTLTTLQQADHGGSKAKRRGRRPAAGAGTEGEEVDDALFVGYDADRRRRKKREEKVEEAEQGLQPAPGLELSAPLLPGLLKEDDPFQLLVDTILSLMDAQRYEEARDLANLGIDALAKRSMNRRKRDSLRILAARAALALGSPNAASNFLKSPATRWAGSPTPWNTFSQIQVIAGPGRNVIKFLSAIKGKNLDSLPLALMLGHIHLLSGNHIYALAEYFQAYRFASEEPLVLLSIGIALINQAVSKHSPDRHAAVLHLFGFILEYARRRRDRVEACYNLGRAAQYFSLNTLALEMYESALYESEKEKMKIGGGVAAAVDELEELEVDDDAEEEERDEIITVDANTVVESGEQGFAVSAEAAYNSALILRASGATSLARDLMKKHLTF